MPENKTSTIVLTDGDREEIVVAAKEAQRRQEHRTYRAIIAGFVLCAVILALVGLFAVIRIETLIHENRQATLDNARQATRIEDRQERILDELSDLVVTQEQGTQRIIISGNRRENNILREMTRDLAAAERRITALLHATEGGTRFPSGGG